MKEFFSHIRGAIVSTLVLAVVCCGLYPLIVFGISQAFFRDKANGSLITGADGSVRGSKLLGQAFSDPKYFHPRPSAAGNGYDATSSGGSNLGPTSQKLDNAIKERIAAYRADNGLSETEPVPADAELQIARVAKARGLSEDKVRELVQQNTDGRDLGVFGDPGLNVLQLNLALDQQH
jgi:potassium-transporting ATPase KdpC subunit